MSAVAKIASLLSSEGWPAERAIPRGDYVALFNELRDRLLADAERKRVMFWVSLDAHVYVEPESHPTPTLMFRGCLVSPEADA